MNWFKRIIKTITFRDRAAGVEVQKKYGTLPWAARDPKTHHDLDASKINANVYIATRAIADAIKGLPVGVVEMESRAGVEREVEDTEHAANDIFRYPNPEHSWSDIVDHIVKSYLSDGNALLTVERNTGPNPKIEIWPRDPRNVDINTGSRHYRFGKYTSNQRTYPRDRVIHIRDMNVDDPFWGIGRINTIREEIMMDYFVNRFNSRFFEHGATLNLMFTPDHDLTEDQHQQILDAMSADIGGANRAFKTFINRYGGKFEWPEQRHKDIAFLELLRHNREKIFGVFGLPPFRGGVMEYANYANALAQDLDFWLNTIKPILKVIEDAFNKQLLWPIYGDEVRIKFDLDSVPAIQGDKNAQIERLCQLKDHGVISAKYVREQLDISEDAAPEESPIPSQDDDTGKDTDSTRDEEEEVENVLWQLFKQQRATVLTALDKLTVSGTFMSVLVDPHNQVDTLFNDAWAITSTKNQLLPILRRYVSNRGTRQFGVAGVVFDPHHQLIDALLHQVGIKIETAVDQTRSLLIATLYDADRYGWTYPLLVKRIKALFTNQRASELQQLLLGEYTKRCGWAIAEIQNEVVANATLMSTKRN